MRHRAMVKGVLSFLVLLLLGYATQGQATPGNLFYRDLMSPKPRQLVLGKDVAMLGHPPWKITICSANDSFYCINSREFKFAVPKRLADTREWARDGARYSVLGDDTYVFGNREERTLLIEQTGDGNPVRFLYSLRRGLIALWLVEADGSTKTFLLLENPCGFGAPPSCSEKANQ